MTSSISPLSNHWERAASKPLRTSGTKSQMYSRCTHAARLLQGVCSTAKTPENLPRIIDKSPFLPVFPRITGISTFPHAILAEALFMRLYPGLATFFRLFPAPRIARQDSGKDA